MAVMTGRLAFVLFAVIPLLVECHPAVSSVLERDPEAKAGPLAIAAFNIQVFGLDKMEDEVAVANIIEILRRYHLVLIQEIRDSTETAIYDLLNQLNAAVSPVSYGIAISERLGRTSSKEQYAFFYDQSIFTVLDEYTYHDNSDVFEREPYIVTFGVTGYCKYFYQWRHLFVMSRFVLSGNLDGFFVPGSATVYNYWTDLGLTEQEALDVSDHYPVEMEFN